MRVGSRLLQISFIQSVDIADTFLVASSLYSILVNRLYDGQNRLDPTIIY